MAVRRRSRRGAPAPLLATPALQIVDRGRPRTPRTLLRRVVRAALEYGGRPDLPVSLLLCDDPAIAAIHERFLGDATPTDVISFEIDGGAEIVVSVATAAREARQREHARDAEVALYVAHGLLHLCGYDDGTRKQRAQMRVAERAVLAAIGIAIDDVDA